MGKKRKQTENFFSDLIEAPKVKNDENTKSPEPPTTKKRKKDATHWAAGSGQKLDKYVRQKEMVDIEARIEECIRKNNLEVVTSAQRTQNAEDFKKIGTVRARYSEKARVERIKQKEAKNRKTKAEQELEKYFEGSKEFNQALKFEDMKLDKRLMQAIAEQGYQQPTAIQQSCVPVALAGRDICGCAATGTGKTAAYLLPTLERLLCAGKPPTPVTRVMVVVPTRELGVQVFQVGQALARRTWVRTALVCGGMKLSTVKSEVLARPDVLIATPGMLVAFLDKIQGFSLASVEVMVLDEADRILDEHFAVQMESVIARCSKQRQTLLFSATLTDHVRALAEDTLRDPVKIFTNSNTKIAQGLEQEYVMLHDGDALTRLANLAFLLTSVYDTHTVVFLPTKILCHRMYVLLRLLGLSVGEMHGKMPQSARLHNLASFADGSLSVLLATDLASRGLDIRNVETVINYELHKTYEVYVHRVGRTARAGKGGLAVSLLTAREYPRLTMIRKQSRTEMRERKLQRAEINAWRARMAALEPLATDIIMAERAVMAGGREAELQKQIDNVSRKAARQESALAAAVEKRKRQATLRELAKAQGLSVQDYVEMKALASNKVSNSKKKQLIRDLERRECNLVTKSKKVLQTADNSKFVNTKYSLQKRKFTNPAFAMKKK